MVKTLTKILQTKVTTLVPLVLSIYATVQLFRAHGYYNYPSITREELNTVLYKSINPNLKYDESVPDCKYEFLSSTKTLNTLKVPKSFANFSAVGVEDGSYAPKHCRPLFSVALLVTYRNRQEQLDIFVPYIHDFLRKQNIHYKLYVIEQQDELEWNKGLLYNVGARLAISEQFPCLVLHDVDLLPLDEANLYACLNNPRHMSASIDKFRFVLPYTWLVGGVTAITARQYVEVDGFSNKYRGWGGEDDDFYTRLTNHNLPLLRVPRWMSRYSMLVHKPEPRNPLRRTVYSAQQSRSDGYASATVRSLRTSRHKLFTLVAAHV